MLVANYIILTIIIIALGILYQKYLEKNSQYSSVDSYNEITKYLMNDQTLDKNKKPILWIYIPHEYNSRNWSSFGSRSSTDINQPYLYLTVKTIIKHCDESFNICLIDDDSFTKLIPGWNIKLNLLTEPMGGYIRQLALTKILYHYGGINVPISFLCFKDLIGLWKKGTNETKTHGHQMFVCENYDMNITSTSNMFYPNAQFMGAKKHNDTIKQFIHYMEQHISSDYTAQTSFLGNFDEWCNHKIHKHMMRLIPGTDVGTKTIDDEPVTVETLLGEDYIHFYSGMYGIWIPDKMILKRNHYEWFARMNPEQIFQSNFILAKYIVLTLAPDSKMGIIEPNKQTTPDWISFWKVPATNGTLNVWGVKPQNLGNNIPRANNAGNKN